MPIEHPRCTDRSDSGDIAEFSEREVSDAARLVDRVVELNEAEDAEKWRKHEDALRADGVGDPQHLQELLCRMKRRVAFYQKALGTSPIFSTFRR